MKVLFKDFVKSGSQVKFRYYGMICHMMNGWPYDVNDEYVPINDLDVIEVSLKDYEPEPKPEPKQEELVCCFTARQLMDKGYWRLFCQVKGVNEWALSEGMSDQEVFSFTQSELDKMGIKLSW